MSRSALLLPAALLGLVGCAGLIGASFDDAHLKPDASAIQDAKPLPDGAEDAGLIDPLAIPKLFAWFSADFGITVQDGGIGVARWESHVPGQYAYPVTLGTAPAFVANVQHDQPAVRFVVQSPQLLKVNAKGLGGKEATLFVVGRGSTHAALAFRLDAFSTPYIAFPYDVHVGVGGGGVSAGLFISNEALAQLPIRAKDWGIWEARYSAGVTSGIETFLNGVPIDKVTPLLGTLPDNLDMYLGGVPPPTSGALVFYDGDLGEILVFQAALDDSTRRNVEAYLSLRWDIPLGK